MKYADALDVRTPRVFRFIGEFVDHRRVNDVRRHTALRLQFASDERAKIRGVLSADTCYGILKELLRHTVGPARDLSDQAAAAGDGIKVSHGEIMVLECFGHEAFAIVLLVCNFTQILQVCRVMAKRLAEDFLFVLVYGKLRRCGSRIDN